MFLTGDFNDREKAFCAITTGKLAITPDSIPSMECAYPPKYYWVDWIFAAGQARFTTLSVDTSTRPKQDQRPPAGRLPHAPRGLTRPPPVVWTSGRSGCMFVRITGTSDCATPLCPHPGEWPRGLH